MLEKDQEFLPTNPDLANILDRTDFYLENFHFWDLFRSQLSGFPVSQMSEFPDSQISRFADFQMPPPDPDELSDFNLAPLPMPPQTTPVTAKLVRIFMHAECCRLGGYDVVVVLQLCYLCHLGICRVVNVPSKHYTACH